VDEQLKRRLIGATVLTSLAVIFLPMLFDGDTMIVENQSRTDIPPAPTEVFQSKQIHNEVLVPVAIDLTEATPEPTPVEKPVPVAKPVAVKKPIVVQKPAATKKPAEGLTSWVIQVGSFSSKSNAEKLVAKLRKGGFDTLELQPTTVNGKRLYRVKVGPEINKANASKQLNGINKISRTRGVVVRYP